MHILEPRLIKEAARKQGYRSLQELAAAIGVHRNTLNYFSRNSVFPESLEKLFEHLRVEPTQVMRRLEPSGRGQKGRELLFELIDKLHEAFPDFTLVLFGSRAKLAPTRPYSDWDIGVFRAEGISHREFRKFLILANELLDKSRLPQFVDWVNLNAADQAFLKNACERWEFLTGRRRDWVQLNARVGG